MPNRATPILPPLDVLRSLDWRPVLLDNLGEDFLVEPQRRLILLDTRLTVRDLAEIAAQFVTAETNRVEELLA